MTSSTPSLFPQQTPIYILSFQFSSWYPHFSSHSIKSTVIRPLSQEFRDYLDTDGVLMPEGSEDVPADSTLSDDEGGDPDEDGDESEDEEDSPPARTFAFPELDARIRKCVKDYGAVFPKLNFSSPRDASWMLPMSSPLKCTSPSEVYMLLKSSDFITHDLSTESVFAGCQGPPPPGYDLELVLRKWYSIDRSREMRCFVREGVLIAISQRDNNYYEFLNESSTQNTIKSTIRQFWEANIRHSPFWGSTRDYIFDFLLTRDLSRGHIIDFNPYAPRTDSLLFTYEELADKVRSRLPLASPPVNGNTIPRENGRHADLDGLPEFRVIDSRSHPATISNVPLHQHNMVPFEALSLSSGRDIEEFAEAWKKEIQESVKGND